MKKLLALLLAMMLLAIPALAEDAVLAEDTAAEPITPESFVGYWNAIGMLAEGEIVPPTAFTTFTIKASVTVGEEGDCEASFEGKYDGENWNTHPYWKEYDLTFESGFERSENGTVTGVGYVYWTLTEEGNLSLAYDGPEGAYTIIFEPTEAPTLDSIFGKWVNTSIIDEEDGSIFPGNEMETLLINEDGTALYCDMIECYWSQEDGAIVIDIGRTFTINGATLERYDNGGYFIYELQ